MVGAELLDGVVGRAARLALVPAIEREQREAAVRDHERRAHRGHRVAPVPGYEVHDLEHPRQKELDPHDAEHAPHGHEHAVRAPVDRQERARVVPGDDAEGELHEPAGEVLERASDDGAHQEDEHDVLVVEAVERHGHEHGSEPVDRRERPEQKPGAVLVVAGVDHGEVVGRLDGEPQHAAYDEYPEQVEEVEGDEPLARLVAAERAVLGLLARFHVAQFALQLALLG